MQLPPTIVPPTDYSALPTIDRQPAAAILNLMLGSGRGGLEQAALDYAEALAAAGIGALTVISPNAWVEAPLVAAGMTHESLSSHGRWDVFAARRLRKLAAKTGARAVICHGNRALALALRAFHPLIGSLANRPRIIAVAHNYSTSRFAMADACFAISSHLAAHLAASGARAISRMPNMVRMHDHALRPAFRHPPVIGSMGRFVAKKGFQTYIEALSVLRTRGIEFHAVLGGDGEESAAIDALIARYRLENHITRIGWVKDKTAFFAALDLFVLPSLHEPFGIVLIEAMIHGVPVISTDTEGPREIIHHGVDGILVPRRDPEALAEALAGLLANQQQAQQLAVAGRVLAGREYSMDSMAQRLQQALKDYI